MNEERKHKSDTELPAREPSASEAAESNVHWEINDNGYFNLQNNINFM